jgi:hypothetical protein
LCSEGRSHTQHAAEKYDDSEKASSHDNPLGYFKKLRAGFVVEANDLRYVWSSDVAGSFHLISS